MKKFFAFVLTAAMLAAALPASFAEPEPAEAAPEAPVFSDISGHYAEDVIVKYSEMGAISGYPDGTFCPDKVVTRAEAATIIARVLESAGKELKPLDPESAGKRGWYKTHSGVACEDIDPNAWYYPYVEKAESYFPMWLPSDIGALEPLGPYDATSNNIRKTIFLPNAGLPRCHLAEIMVELKFSLYGLENSPDDIDDGYTARNNLKKIYKDPTLIENLGSIANKYGVPNNWSRMRNYIWLAYKYEIMTGFPDGYFYPYSGVTRAQLLVSLDNILNSGEAVE